jgi:predicted ribosomally synthesized peptide with SipW-like signal peptide
MIKTSRARKALLSLLVVGAVGAVVSAGAFSAFSSSSTNSGNEFKAGTVVLGSNDGGQPMYAGVSAVKPGQQVTRCIAVAYTGSLTSDVHLYTTDSSIGALGKYVDVTVTPGHWTGSAPTFPGCTGFASNGAAAYSGTLENFQQTKNSYANGVALSGPATSYWATGNTVVYQFSYTLQDNNSANSSDPNTPLTTGLHSFKFEAQSN